MAKSGSATNRRKRRGDLDPFNVHFTPNTAEALKLHSALTNSGGRSGLIRTIVEWYMATAIPWGDPRYDIVDPVEKPAERYKGQHKRLGLIG